MRHFWELIVNTAFDKEAPVSSSAAVSLAPQVESVSTTLSRCRRCGRWRNERRVRMAEAGALKKRVSYGDSPPAMETTLAWDCSKDLKLDFEDLLSQSWRHKVSGNFRRVKLARLHEAWVLDHWGEWINVADKAPLVIVFDEYYAEKTFTMDAGRILWHSTKVNGHYLTEEQLAIREVIK